MIIMMINDDDTGCEQGNEVLFQGQECSLIVVAICGGLSDSVILFHVSHVHTFNDYDHRSG